MESMIITECPRDAIQGRPYFIPTKTKVAYLTTLIETGFSRIDIGSFVSPRAIPQLADTAQVLSSLQSIKKDCEFLVIVGSEKGALRASVHPEVDILGFPWSISDKFLSHNIRSDKHKSRELILRLLEICTESQKDLLVYISMAYGNPYGEKWDIEMLIDAYGALNDMGISRIALSDTIGFSKPNDIYYSLSEIHKLWPETDPGFHLHTRPQFWKDRVSAAWEGGCRRFDSVLDGMGGCPMSGYELVGNLDTMNLIEFCKEKEIEHNLDENALLISLEKSSHLLSSGTPL